MHEAVLLPNLFFAQVDVTCVVKMLQKYIQCVEMYLYGFFQTAIAVFFMKNNSHLFS